MSGRKTWQPVINPGVRTFEQQQRRLAQPAKATASRDLHQQDNCHQMKGHSAVEVAATASVACAVNPKVAKAVLKALSNRSKLHFAVVCVQSTSWPNLSKFEDPCIRISDSCQVYGGDRRGLWLKYFAKVHQTKAVECLLKKVGGSAEVHSGPFDKIPYDDEALPEGVSLKHGFRAGFTADLKHAACSTEAEDLLRLMDFSFGDVSIQDARGVTSVHLAALAGDIALAGAMVQHAAELNLPQGHWQDEDGRTPLHLAVFLNNGQLARIFVDLCGIDTKDRWGHTAADLASALGHWDALGGVTSEPGGLQQACLRRLSSLTPEALAAILPSEASLLAKHLPLHEYGLLSRLSAAHLGVIDPVHLARSMSCLECWHADLCNVGCSAVLDGCHELIRVWDDLPSFANAAQHQTGVVLVRRPGPQSPLTVADRATFLARFHQRTGGVLRDIDWSNLMVIGGMVLACFTADDEEYRRNYKGTDVDIYVVGLRGQAFKDRVADLVESLPRHPHAYNFSIRVTDASKLTVGLQRGRLVYTGVGGKPTTVKSEPTGFPELCPGDVILEVDGESNPNKMMSLLKSSRICQFYGRGPQRVPHYIKAQSSKGGMDLHGTVLRTPQTLTTCLWNSQRKRPEPNVQIVLAPYESPAHLLYTTDIDCTAMGFDGMHLVAAPRAREAIRHRCNVTRPEKYMVRGEWRTEARLMKYAMRGFSVVDLGLKSANQIQNRELQKLAMRAEELLQMPRPVGESEPSRQAAIKACVKEVASLGVRGAGLLLQASRLRGLRWLMLHESPLLPAGLQWQDAKKIVRSTMPSRWGREDSDVDSEDAGSSLPHSTFDFDDGYGSLKAQLSIVNPASRHGDRVEEGGLRGLESSLMNAIVELDIESDRFEVQGWYDSIPESAVHVEHTSLDPLVWRGVGDFRRAP